MGSALLLAACEESKETGEVRMKVKIGNSVFDGEKQPVMVILSPEDKENIANMSPEASKYASYPEDSDPRKIENWMSLPHGL